MPPRELRVVDAEQAHHRGVDVVHRGRVPAVERLVAPLVALAVGHAALHASAAHPVGEDERIVVAALARLRARHAAELGGPDDQRVVEHAALPEVGDERRRAARHAARERPVVAADVLVRVPVAPRVRVVVAAPHLHEAHAALEQAPRCEALLREDIRLLGVVDVLVPGLRVAVEPVEPQHMLGLRLDVKGLGRSHLHARRELVALDARVEPLVLRARLGVRAVHRGEELLRVALARAVHEASRRVRAEVCDRIGGAWVDHRAAVLARKERAVPVLHAVRRHAAVVGQHDEGRQVLVQRAETVAHPAARARESRQLEARRRQRGRGRMHARAAGDIVDERDVVDMRAELRDGFAEHLAALAVRLELPRGLHPRPEPVLEGLDLLAEIAGLSVVLDELGLEVEEIEVAGRARHEELHDALRLRRELQRRGSGSRVEEAEGIARKHRGERDAAESATRAPEELAARERVRRRLKAMEGRVIAHRVISR